MKVFLTGDMGMMGTSLKENLDYEWVGYDLINGQDLLDYDKLVEAMKGCDVVVHAAAIPHPNDLMGFIPFFDVNVRGTVNVLEAARHNKVKKFIQISSTAYYLINMRSFESRGSTSRGKVYMDDIIDEAHPTQLGRSSDRFDAYDISKLMDEAACAWYGTNTDMQVLVLRFGPVVEEDFYFLADPDKDGTWRTRSQFGWTHPQSVISGVDLALKYDGDEKYTQFVMVDHRPTGFTPEGPMWDTLWAQNALGWKPRIRPQVIKDASWGEEADIDG